MNPQWLAIIHQEAFRIDAGHGQREDLQQEGMIAVLGMAADTPGAHVRCKVRWVMINYLRNCGLKTRAQVRAEKREIVRTLTADHQRLLTEAFEHAPDTLPDLTRALEAMTPRQNEVLTLLVDGLTLEVIAQRLGITESRACQIAGSIKDRINGVPDRIVERKKKSRLDKAALGTLLT